MWKIITHDQTKNLIVKSFSNDTFFHAYIISGNRHIGKMTLALDIAASLNCLSNSELCGSCKQCVRVFNNNHSDIKIIGDDKEGLDYNNKTISIEVIRKIQSESNLKPFEGKYRVYIINGAENLSIEASNALLKLLEEPPQQVVFILLTIDNELILPTVLSRCKQIVLRPIQNNLVEEYLLNNYDISADQASGLSRASKGLLGWAIRAYYDSNIIIERDQILDKLQKLIFADDIDRFEYAKELSNRFVKNKNDVYSDLELWVELWRDILYIKLNVPELIVNTSRKKSLYKVSQLMSNYSIVNLLRKIEETESNLKININPRLIFESLMLDIPILQSDHI
ncbi:MAG: hypothetical protein CL758_02580 [Chloroflexi bacterium]|nr:hypothetical protein [Chloroflexota bacterium]|tara:strand:- start:10336 stop:11352 length:1017 start_codon:yes stop_codon:yes gene_type:complete